MFFLLDLNPLVRSISHRRVNTCGSLYVTRPMQVAEKHGYLRNERELYGASGRWDSQDQTSFGEPRFSFSGFAALPDQLPQRDIFQTTEGSIFFLSRQDIAIGTERITVQFRDRTTGRVFVYRNRHSLTNAFGVNYDPNDSVNYSAAVTVETVTDDINGDFDRNAIPLVSEAGPRR